MHDREIGIVHTRVREIGGRELTAGAATSPVIPVPVQHVSDGAEEMTGAFLAPAPAAAAASSSRMTPLASSSAAVRNTASLPGK